MTAIRRAFKALLLAEVIMLIVGAVPMVALWLVLVATAAGSPWLALLVPGVLSLAAPLVAFGEGGGRMESPEYGKPRVYVGGGLYGHLRRADDIYEAEMRKLLAEHGS